MGFELIANNEAGTERSLHITTLTDGELPGLRRFALPGGVEKEAIEIAVSTTEGLVHWTSIVVPAPNYETLNLWVVTRPGGQNSCQVSGFRTRRSG